MQVSVQFHDVKKGFVWAVICLLQHPKRTVLQVWSLIQHPTTYQKGQQNNDVCLSFIAKPVVGTCLRGTRVHPCLPPSSYFHWTATASQPAWLWRMVGSTEGVSETLSSTHTLCISRDYSHLGQPFLSSTIFTSIIILLFLLCFVALCFFPDRP